MLDLRRCRELVGPGSLSDDELLRLRNGMYELAAIVVDDFQRKKRRAQRAGVQSPTTP